MKWAALVAKDARPAILNEKHTDWPFFLRWVPRSWTAWLGGPPRKLWGNAASTKPIPAASEWWIGLPLYVAITTKGKWHARAGFRFDDVDRYYALSFTIKKVGP